MNDFTPAACHAAAQHAIGEYIQQVGAHGDPDKVRKALEILISTSMHVAQRMEDGNAYPETVQQ